MGTRAKFQIRRRGLEIPKVPVSRGSVGHPEDQVPLARTTENLASEAGGMVQPKEKVSANEIR